jgi:2-keto-3-deoxy-L-fuconate dehydrogenase
VAPGTADTPWVARLLAAANDPNAAADALRRRHASGRLVSAEEVAYGIASLASLLAGSTTGTILRIDGGMTSLRL